MMKKIVAGTVALTIAGVGLALAQQMPPRDAQGWRPNAERGFGRSAEDAAAFTDARIAALKAGLRLNADQDKLWPAMEPALRDLAQQRADRMKRWAERMEMRRGSGDRGERADRPDEAPRPDAMARLRRDADALSTRGAALKKLADAVEPLYQSLDDGQKRRFTMLFRMGGRGGAGERGGWHRRGERRADSE